MLYTLLKPIAKLILYLKFRIEVIGTEHIPHQTPYIVAANHISNYDPLVLSCTIMRKIHYMAKVELFRSRFSSCFFTALHAIPIDRHGGNPIRPVRKVLKIIGDGEIFGIFPEGKRRKNEKEIPPKRGVGYFASKTGIPILPVAIIFLENKYRKTIKVIIGPLIYVNDVKVDKSKDTTISLFVMEQIKTLMMLENLNK
ncbi:lysophospholipid acyltransferase family protein [Metabacillus herbersteinensis]|uniref:1-acyl-sn-glycerol-3-phosphate acyltransferase n=1 Tax=Metabacillus herbersteinensis TaxID=283816 RepID=A0ABV6GKJ0_9BACI